MGRIFACSDIHGHLTQLIKLLEAAQPNLQEDTLVFLGDYIHRGPDPVECLRFVQKLQAKGAIVLRGNNEDFFLDSWDDAIKRSRLYQDSLTARTVLEFEALSGQEQDNLLEFMNKMPLFYETDDYIFVHAGIRPGTPPSRCTKKDLLWRRDLIECNTGLGKKVIFGHTPTETGKINILGDKIAIDCGAALHRRLGMLELPAMLEYYADI
ncbi:MAG: metallophosphoesterase family protein [Bacillota bacterium]